ncbi:MAG: dihydroneopterin aldolase [Bacteroidales bacterium]|nr:dihydroneopterin aldolase [Bacteroidales bacterium]
MGKIELSDLRFHAYHGCLQSERISGTEYRVDVVCHAPLAKASRSDNLKDSVDYSLIYNIVKDEMAHPSNLLEHVAGNILRQIRRFAPKVRHASVTVTKFNPPFDYPDSALDTQRTGAGITLSF